MSKSNAFETEVLAYVFTDVAMGIAGATQLDIHLHTADPGEAGTSATNEATYTGYAAETVDRATSDWTVTGDTVVNDLLIQFGLCTAGTNTLTHVSITEAGQTQILYSGALSASLAVSAGIQPQFAPGALTITEG